jgi:hypothetical protein
VVQPTHCQELGNEVSGDAAHTMSRVIGHKVLDGSAHALSGVRAQGDWWFRPHIVKSQGTKYLIV